MKTLSSLVCAIFLTACGATMMLTKDGTMIANAGVMSKNEAWAGEIVDGKRKMKWSTLKNDATDVPLGYIAGKVAVNVSNNAKEVDVIKQKARGEALVKGTKDPNVIPLDPNAEPAIAKDPNTLPLNPNVIPK